MKVKNIEKYIRFQKAVETFLVFIERFSDKKIIKKDALRKIIGLRRAVIKIRDEIIIFYDFAQKEARFLNGF